MKSLEREVGEIYYTSTSKKLIVGIVLVVFVIASILSFIFSPDLKFSYLFGEIEYGVAFTLISVFLFFFFVSLFGEQRESKIYLTKDGNIDIITPREYVALKPSPISNILGRANILYQKNNLRKFYYSNGHVYVENSRGEIVDEDLKDITFQFKMTKNKLNDEWNIYQYIITDKQGNKVRFNRHDALFNDEEYSDIEMILSLSGNVVESKISKVTKWADEIVSKVENLDPSDIVGSVVDVVEEEGTTALTNKVGQIARAKLINNLLPQKSSLFSKIKKYFFITVVVIYAIIVIVLNIENIREYAGYSNDTNTEDFSEYGLSETYNDEEDMADVAVVEDGYDADSLALNYFMELASNIDYVYDCEYSDGNTFLLAIIPETGSGAYLAPSGNVYELSIEDESDDRTQFICTVENTDGTPKGLVFHVEFSEDETVSGIMVNTEQDITFEFYGKHAVENNY